MRDDLTPPLLTTREDQADALCAAYFDARPEGEKSRWDAGWLAVRDKAEKMFSQDGRKSKL